MSASLLVGESDTAFLKNVTTTLASLDNGLHIGTWGEIKELKIPDALGYDFENDTHRHLVGWYPGYSISSFLGGYQNNTIQNAVAKSLYSRGLGNGPDANAGWEKVWRSACWARLNHNDMAYLELKYAINTNFANNGLSMYTALNPPFQIDANFGLCWRSLEHAGCGSAYAGFRYSSPYCRARAGNSCYVGGRKGSWTETERWWIYRLSLGWSRLGCWC